MPLFGRKKKEEEPPIPKPQISQHKEHVVPGTPCGLVLCNLQNQEAMVVSSLEARGLTAMTVDGEKLWTYDTGATAYSLAVGDFTGQSIIFAGSNEKVFAISEAGKELWQYEMPATKSRFIKGLAGLGGKVADAEKRRGLQDVHHIATGKLDGEDVVIAMAGGLHGFEGPQILSSKGEHRGALKMKVLGRETGLTIAGGYLDLSPKGDAILALWPSASEKGSNEVRALSRKGETIRKFKVDVDFAPTNRVTVGGIQDKFRGKLAAGKLDDIEAFVLGAPNYRSVAAVSLQGTQLWKYETSRKGVTDAGINDVAIGSIKGKSAVVIGTFDRAVHIVAGNGSRLDSWIYPTNVTNVAWGRIKGKDAIAVGLFNGQILTYTVEPS